MKISKFINNVSKENIFHSNDMAKIATGGTLGSGSAETFQRRSQINRSRQSVRRYGESMIGQGDMKALARHQLNTSNPLRRSEPRVPNRQQLGARGIASQIPPRTFKEPPGRGFNPYQ
jgi:hypothetical protein